MQQLQTLANQNWTIPFSHLIYILIIVIHFVVIETAHAGGLIRYIKNNLSNGFKSFFYLKLKTLLNQ